MPCRLPKPMQTMGLVLAAATLIASAPSASAEDYPTRPIHVIVPFAPGGGSDFIARFMGVRLGELLGKPLVVENKPGAGGALGAEVGVKAAPDGYTLTVIASSYTVNPAIRKVNFDFRQRHHADHSVLARSAARAGASQPGREHAAGAYRGGEE